MNLFQLSLNSEWKAKHPFMTLMQYPRQGCTSGSPWQAGQLDILVKARTHSSLGWICNKNSLLLEGWVNKLVNGTLNCLCITELNWNLNYFIGRHNWNIHLMHLDFIQNINPAVKNIHFLKILTTVLLWCLWYFDPRKMDYFGQIDFSGSE